METSYFLKCCYLSLSSGFFVVDFATHEERQSILESGTWFWESLDLFMKPWIPSSDPSTIVISLAPV